MKYILLFITALGFVPCTHAGRKRKKTTRRKAPELNLTSPSKQNGYYKGEKLPSGPRVSTGAFTRRRRRRSFAFIKTQRSNQFGVSGFQNPFNKVD